MREAEPSGNHKWREEGMVRGGCKRGRTIKSRLEAVGEVDVRGGEPARES